MKTKVVKIFSILGALLFVAVAAHAADVLAISNIPFGFEVGNVALPAGEYTVQRMGSGSPVYLIRSTDGLHAAFFEAVPAEPRAGQDKDWTLVFDRIGNKDFLKDVWLGPWDRGLALPESKHERELLAMGQTKPVTEFAEVRH